MNGLSKKYLLLPLMLLTVCSTLTGCKVLYRATVETPPEALYAVPCSGSSLEPRSAPFLNEDHLRYTLELKAALRGCEADREAIKAWKDAL